MSDTDTAMTAAEAWMAGDMQGAQALSQPIPDGPPVAPSGDIPAYLENHLAVQGIEQKQNAAPDPAQAETAIISRAATTLSELGPEGQALVQEWGGHTSADFQTNLTYARDAFRDIVANRPDLIAKVDASGLGNDPAVLKILSELGRQKAHTYGDDTVSSRRFNDGPSQALPSGNSAAQRELNKIFKETPPGSEGYKTSAVQNRVRQLSEMIAGSDGGGSIVGQGGRIA